MGKGTEEANYLGQSYSKGLILKPTLLWPSRLSPTWQAGIHSGSVHLAFEVVLSIQVLSFLPSPYLLSLSPLPKTPLSDWARLHHQEFKRIYCVYATVLVIVAVQGNAQHGPPNSPRSSQPCVNIPSLNQPKKTTALSSEHSKLFFWTEFKKKKKFCFFFWSKKAKVKLNIIGEKKAKSWKKCVINRAWEVEKTRLQLL